MKLRQISVKNFRCLKDIVVPISDSTVLLGENNTGKTALLDALRIALTRSGTNRSSPFSEYDYYMETSADSPKSSEGIVIELLFKEDSTGQWPVSVTQALDAIIRTDPYTDLDSICLRVTSRFEPSANDVAFNSEFLALDGQPLVLRGGTPRNVSLLQEYMRLFYLSSLRDADAEFSPRSQYWGRILRDLNISDEQQAELAEELGKLNESLLKSDPRLEEVSNTLNQIQTIMGIGSGPRTSIQALPLKPWDLMSRAEVVIKARGSDVAFPLTQHGQGLQSLAVLFVFQAYVQVLLKPSFKPETEAILALEEPEAHLHPQAVRALSTSLEEMESQKVISTHSPYFVQEIPFTDIRMFRRDGSTTKVLYIKRMLNANVPITDELITYCSNNLQFQCDHSTSTLIVTGRITDDQFRDILSLYPGQPEVHVVLRQLHTESQMYLTDEDLSDLETYAKRIRGEILFARGWILCEGQSEYLLLRCFADMLGHPLDEAGIAVIDYQNNGSAGAFVGLARAFEIPWILFCDNDSEGPKIISQVKNHGLSDIEVANLVRPLPGENTTWERFLITNGFLSDLLEVLAGDDQIPSKNQGEEGFEDEIVSMLERHKRRYSAALADKLLRDGADESKVPELIRTLIADMVDKVA